MHSVEAAGGGPRVAAGRMHVRRRAERLRGARAAGSRLAFVLAATFGGACATAGTAVGTAEVPGRGTGPATFYWESQRADPTSGEIHARMPDGRRYSGTYFEITQDVTTSSLGPLWVGWEPYWTAWGAPWAPGTPGYATTNFTTIYSGRVLATLRSADGDGMRCRFTLRKPDRGLAGGGFGECQTKSGAVVEDAVLTRE